MEGIGSGVHYCCSEVAVLALAVDGALHILLAVIWQQQKSLQ